MSEERTGSPDRRVDTRSIDPETGRQGEFDDPIYRCSYCAEGFSRERSLALHRGLEHYDALSGTHREAFAAARDAEERDLRRFRLLALGALVVLYFGLLMVYVLV